LVSTLEQELSQNQKVEGAMKRDLATNASRLQQGDATSSRDLQDSQNLQAEQEERRCLEQKCLQTEIINSLRQEMSF